MLATNVMLARASARPVAARRQRAVEAKASAVEKASQSTEAIVTMRERVERVGKTVLSGVAVAGLASAVAPEPALAVSLRDPVFGDIQVWQFIVLTAGYWWGIEYYLNNKYDEPDAKKNPVRGDAQGVLGEEERVRGGQRQERERGGGESVFVRVNRMKASRSSEANH